MTEHERQAIEQAVSRLIFDLVHYTDTRDYGRFAALFTPDAKLHRPTSTEPLNGREAIAEAYRKTPAERVNRHLVSNLRVQVESANSARATAYVTLYSSDQSERVDEPFGAPVGRCLVGEFHDHAVLTDEGWRLAERRAVFVMHQPNR
ncbi:MAG: nuclear transport factor 2 family protein [Saccharospirillum sp.]